MASSLPLITMMTLIKSQSVLILKDSETWTDDYSVNMNGIDGWKYPPSLIPPVVGSDRTYHGWYYYLYKMQYLGYFYRQFQCEYSSTVHIKFRIYFGCEYDAKDGAILYINSHQFRFNVSQHILSNYTDQVAIDQTNKCQSNYNPGTFVGFDASTSSEPIVDAYTTFDVGFRMINTHSRLTQEFGAISDIEIVCICNKLNNTTPSTPSTPINAITPSVSNPLDNIACSNMEQSTCSTNTLCAWDESKCTCNSGDAVDIIFGIGMYSTFEYNLIGQKNMERWFIDDIVPNINNDISRIGFILFDETVTVSMNIGYYTPTQLHGTFSNVSWIHGFSNFPAFLEQSVAQFDSIETPNKEQILVIVTDGDPKVPPHGEHITICHYRNLLATKGIRVVMVVINYIGNSPHIEDYDCITQNSFDLLLTPWPILYDNLHNITDTLSAVLCPYAISTSTKPTLHPITSATTQPTVSPTIHPILSITVFDAFEIEIIFKFQNISNITVEISNIILSIVAVETNLEKDQINMTLYRDKVIIKAKGDEHQINDIVQSINNGHFEREIQDEIGQKPTITIAMIQRDDMTISSTVASDVKRLIIVLIILVSTLIFVIIIVSLVCCYCLFIKKKDSVTLPPKSVEPRACGYHNVDHGSHTHHTTVSIPSMTGYSYDINIPTIVPTVFLENHLRQMTGEYDYNMELPSTNVIIIPEDTCTARDVEHTIDGEYHEESYSDNNGLYGPGVITKIDETSMNESSDDDDDDADAMYLKNDETRTTKGR